MNFGRCSHQPTSLPFQNYPCGFIRFWLFGRAAIVEVNDVPLLLRSQFKFVSLYFPLFGDQAAANRCRLLTFS